MDPASVLDGEIAAERRRRAVSRVIVVALLLLSLLVAWFFWPHGASSSRRGAGQPPPTCTIGEQMDGGPVGSGERGLVPGLPLKLADLDGIRYHVTYRHEPGARPGTLLTVTRCTPDNAYALTVAR